MIVENQTAESQILSYVVASGDMRCIDIAERVVFVRNDPELGPVIRGELPECAPGSYVDLSYILLEYVMSCDDRREARHTARAADNFGQLIAQKIIDLGQQEDTGEIGDNGLVEAIIVVLKSMDIHFESELSNDRLRFRLDHCPLHAMAEKSGMNLWVALAHRSLFALLERLAQILQPDWVVKIPDERESKELIEEFVFTRG